MIQHLFFQKTLDSFVVTGFNVSNSTGVDATVSPGIIVGNGVHVEVDTATPVSVSAPSGTYYLAATVNPATGLVSFDSNTNPASVIGDVNSTTVLLHKFTHNGSIWTDDVDIRRFGMLVNNKNCFTVGNDSVVGDGYGADFLTIKAAVEHVKALNSAGSAKRASTKIILVDDVTISTAAEADILINADGMELDGGGRTVTITVDQPLFRIDADHVKIHNFTVDFNGLTAPTGAKLADIARGTNVSRVRIEGNTQIATTGDPAAYFLRVGDGSSSYSATDCVFSNNNAEVGTGGIVPRIAIGSATNAIQNAHITDNRIVQPTIATTAEAGVRVGSFSIIDSNFIEGGFDVGLELTNSESTVATSNVINGGTGTRSGVGVPFMARGILLRSGAGNSVRSIIDGNIIKGTFTVGIDVNQTTATDVIVSNNYIDSRFDAPGVITGIQGNGASTLVTGNAMYGVKSIGIDNCSIVIGNVISDPPTVSVTAINVTGTDALISDNKIINGTYAGITVANSSTGSMIINNTMVAQTSGLATSGIVLGTGCHNCIIAGNHIKWYGAGASSHVIKVAGGFRLLISNNALEECGTVAGNSGISVASGAHNIISGNSINGIFAQLSGAGIDLNTSTDSVVNGNIIYGANFLTVGISNAGSRVVVSNNFVQSISGYGIDGDGSEWVCANNYIDTVTRGIDAIGGASQQVVIGNYVRAPSEVGIDGRGDQNMVLNNYIDTPTGDGLRIGKEGVCSGNHVVNGGDDGILISNDGAVVVGNQIINPTLNAIYADSSAQGIVVCNNHVASVGAAGISADNPADSLFVGNYLHSCTTDGIIIGGGGDKGIVANNYIWDPASDGIVISSGANFWTVSGNYVYSAASYGISIIGAGCMVANNFVYDPTSAGIYFGSAANDTLIIGNWIYDAGSYGLYSSSSPTRVSIIGNIIYNPASSGLRGFGSDWLIANNRIYSAGGNGIFISGGNLIMTGNHIVSSTNHGIDLSGGDISTISNNFISSNGDDGISMASCSHIVINGNIFLNNDLDAVGGTTNTNSWITISGNYFNGDGGGNAIALEQGDEIAITGNMITEYFNGIDLEDAVDFCITGNHFRSIGDDCIDADGAQNGTISGNYMESPSWGIYAPDGAQIVISGNYIFNNGTGSYGIHAVNLERCVINGNFVWAQGTASGTFIFTSVAEGILVGNASWGKTASPVFSLSGLYNLNAQW